MASSCSLSVLFRNVELLQGGVCGGPEIEGYVRISGETLFIVIAEQQPAVRRVDADEAVPWASRVLWNSSDVPCREDDLRRLERWMSHLRNLT